MNLKNIKKEASSYDPFKVRNFLGEVLLVALAIGYVSEHVQQFDHGMTVASAAIFIGLVVYFKNKH